MDEGGQQLGSQRVGKDEPQGGHRRRADDGKVGQPKQKRREIAKGRAQVLVNAPRLLGQRCQGL